MVSLLRARRAPAQRQARGVPRDRRAAWLRRARGVDPPLWRTHHGAADFHRRPAYRRLRRAGGARPRRKPRSAAAGGIATLLPQSAGTHLRRVPELAIWDTP